MTGSRSDWEPTCLADWIRFALFGWMCVRLPFDAERNAYILAQLASGWLPLDTQRNND